MITCNSAVIRSYTGKQFLIAWVTLTTTKRFSMCNTLVMGDISILYWYCFVFSDIRSIDLISKSQYFFDMILHVIHTSFRWSIIIIIMAVLTLKVINNFSVCFHYSNCKFWVLAPSSCKLTRKKKQVEVKGCENVCIFKIIYIDEIKCGIVSKISVIFLGIVSVSYLNRPVSRKA